MSMPEAQHYFIIALAATILLCGLLGWAVFILWTKGMRWERYGAAGVSIAGIAIVCLWLLFYKQLQLEGARQFWIILWSCSAAGLGWLGMRALSLQLFPPNRTSADAGRRAFIEQGVAAAAGVVLAGQVAAYDPADVVVEHHQVEMPHLPRTADGITIAVLSDIHAGPFIEPRHVEYYVQLIRRRRPDVILLPGDFITSHAEEFVPFYKAIRQLQAPYGVLAVLGNHDYFNSSAPLLRQMLESSGVQVLEHAMIEIEGVQFIGISDYYRHIVHNRGKHQSHQSLLHQLSCAKCPVVMVHRPFVFDALAELHRQVLVIAGHTHGGQIVASVGSSRWAITQLFSRYTSGWYASGSARMYVTRGVGTIGVPLRIGAPPEITVITLRRAYA
ncbi:MAG: metallophosphoesterase [Bacteroidota bacterium]|nr:metallophosphoesterase [Bacteroidota bacterium]